MDISRVAELLPDDGMLFGPCVRKEQMGLQMGPTPIDVVVGDQGAKSTLVNDLREAGLSVEKVKNVGAQTYTRTEYELTHDGKHVVLNVHTPRPGKSNTDVVNAKYSADINRLTMTNLDDIESLEPTALDNIENGTYRICDDGFGPTEQSELIASKFNLFKRPTSKKDNNRLDSSKMNGRVEQTTAANKEISKMGTKEMGFLGMMKTDAENAAYRVAATQITSGTKAAILTIMEKQGSGSDKLKAVSDMLDTEFGNALISMLVGMGLTYAPKISEDPRVIRLAGEFRTNGIAVAGNAVMGVAFEHLLPVITNALSALPAVEAADEKAQLRAGGESETEEEEEERTPAKK